MVPQRGPRSRLPAGPLTLCQRRRLLFCEEGWRIDAANAHSTLLKNPGPAHALQTTRIERSTRVGHARQQAGEAPESIEAMFQTWSGSRRMCAFRRMEVIA